MSAVKFLNKFLRFNSVIVNNTPNVDVISKIQTINYTASYFTFLQNDFLILNEKVAKLQKEISETKTKLVNGCGCSCNK